ncbi:MAG TPA: metal-dependent hydrolase [Vicinamibacterales bacterium]
MFVGHFAVALGAKRAAPRVPLGLLVGAAIGLDLLWPLLLLTGVESARIDPGNTAFTPLAFDSYPWSHSLVMALVWGALLALVAFPRLKSAASAALVAAVVVSHWVLDYVTHRPDMPLWPGGPKEGLALWNSIPGTFIVEGLLFAGAISLYTAAFPARDRTGTWAFWAVIAFMTLMWATSPWSPPPPGMRAVAVVGVAMWLFPLWGAWVDRHRGVSR